MTTVTQAVEPHHGVQLPGPPAPGLCALNSRRAHPRRPSPPLPPPPPPFPHRRTPLTMSAAYIDEDDVPHPGEQLAEDMNEQTRMKYSKGTRTHPRERREKDPPTNPPPPRRPQSRRRNLRHRLPRPHPRHRPPRRYQKDQNLRREARPLNGRDPRDEIPAGAAPRKCHPPH